QARRKHPETRLQFPEWQSQPRTFRDRTFACLQDGKSGCALDCAPTVLRRGACASGSCLQFVEPSCGYIRLLNMIGKIAFEEHMALQETLEDSRSFAGGSGKWD